MTIRTSAAEVVLFRCMALPFALLTTIVTSRALHPDGQGRFVLAVLVPTVLATLLSFGVSSAHAIGRGDDAAGVSRRLLAACWWLGVAAMVVAGAFLSLASEGLWFAASALPALVISQGFGGLLLATGRVRAWNVAQLATQAFPCAGIVLLVVVLGKGVGGALVGWSLGQLLAALLYVGGARALLLASPVAPARRRTPLLSLALRAGGVNVASLLNYRIDLLIVAAISGVAVVGVYSLSVQFAELLWLLSSAIATVGVRRIVAGDDRRAASLVCQASRQALVVTSMAGLILALVVIATLPLVFGDAYASARVPFLLLLPGVVAYSPGACLAVYFSMRHGATLPALASVLVSGSVTALVAVPLVRAAGAAGAAMASDLGYLAGMVMAVTLFLRLAHVPLRQLVPGGEDVRAWGSWISFLRQPRRAAPGLR